MNKNVIIKIVVSAFVICIVVVLYFVFVKNMNTQGTKYTPVATPPISHAPNIVNGVYSNQYLTLTVPAGWKLTEATKIGAVNLTKGNYILYINPRVSQASGVEGGRFEEYAGGSPSVGAVVVYHPGGPCGTSDTYTLSLNATTTRRTDFYIHSRDKTESCATPTNGQTVWYFSDVGLGINYYNISHYSGPVGWVVTMAYNSTTIDSFPVKGSADLDQALSEMTNILKTLTINPPVPYIPPVSQKISTIPDTYWSSSFSEGLNSPVTTCSDTLNTLQKEAIVATNYSMESLGSNSQASYSSTDVQTHIGTIEEILVGDGWSKCNHVNTTDVYQKGIEFVNVDGRPLNSSYNIINVTFFKLK